MLRMCSWHRPNAYHLQQAFLTARPQTTGAARRLSPSLPEAEEPEETLESRIARISTSEGEFANTLSRRLERVMARDVGPEAISGSCCTSPETSQSSPRSSNSGSKGGRERRRSSSTSARTPSTASRRRNTTHSLDSGQVSHNNTCSPVSSFVGGMSFLGLPVQQRSTAKNLPPLDEQPLTSIAPRYSMMNHCAQPRPVGTQIHICNSAMVYLTGAVPGSGAAVSRNRGWRLPPLAGQRTRQFRSHTGPEFGGITSCEPGSAPPLLLRHPPL